MEMRPFFNNGAVSSVLMGNASVDSLQVYKSNLMWFKRGCCDSLRSLWRPDLFSGGGKGSEWKAQPL